MKKNANDKNSFRAHLDEVMQLAKARKEALERLAIALTEEETRQESEKNSQTKTNKNKNHKTNIL
ncbi:MAG: hypothetical protein K9G61_07105 [Bacteroidales bacterium]|nr:hypothetical protein [Bacteroidales bacterium]